MGVPESTDYKIVVVPGGNKPVYVETGYPITSNISDYEAVIPEASISGAVTLSDDAAGKIVQVYLLSSNGKYKADVQAEDKGDGSYDFTFEGVSAANYKVAAFSAGYTFGWYADGATGLGDATEVQAGDSGIDFTLNKQ